MYMQFSSNLSLRRAVALGLGLFAITVSVQAETIKRGPVTTYIVSPQEAQSEPDYINARPLALPEPGLDVAKNADQDLISNLSGAELPSLGDVTVQPGAVGNGKTKPVFLGKPQVYQGDDVGSQEFGTQNHVFSTARADLAQGSTAVATNQFYPYRASGKLFFSDGGSDFICSASLIKKGIVLTAAHCVSKFGANRRYTNIRFVPGYRNGAAPYGTWAASAIHVPTSYLDGTMSCSTPGIVCTGDIALIQLTAQNNAYPGTNTGWYGYGTGGYSFTSGLSIAASQQLTQITQIGYPACLDNGQLMERNDSMGFVSAANSSNTIIGSLMCGGSSGGPWIVNFGIRPSLTGTSIGTAPESNIVVGVTSWGYTSTTPKQQGASPFTSTNITPLVTAACANSNPRCAP